MREYMKQLLQTFFIINMGITIGAATFITFLQKDTRFGVEILWQIILVSLIAAFSNIVLYSKNEASKKEIFIRKVIHYFIINIIVLGNAYLFKWIEIGETAKILSLIMCIFFVYIFVWISSYKNDFKTAEILNKKINEYNKNL